MTEQKNRKSENGDWAFSYNAFILRFNMFKKRNRQNSNRRVRNREESSDEESSTPIIKSTNHLNEKTETTKDIVLYDFD